MGTADKITETTTALPVALPIGASAVNVSKLHEEFAQAGLPIVSVADTDGTKERVRMDFERPLTSEEEQLVWQLLDDHSANATDGSSTGSTQTASEQVMLTVSAAIEEAKSLDDLKQVLAEYLPLVVAAMKAK